MDVLTMTMPYYESGSLPQILISTAFILAGTLFGILLGRSKVRTDIALLICGLLLMVSEVLKEVFLFHIYGQYSWSDFPFQLCSVPMYLCVLYYFLKKLWIEQFIMIYSLLGAAASFLVPAGSFSVYVFFTVHSLFWHAMLLFLGVFLIIRQPCESLRLRNFIPVGLAYLIFAGIAVLFNSLFFDISGGTMNLFFLGPGWPDMLILNELHENHGWFISTAGMVSISEAAGFLLYLLISLSKCTKRDR